MNACEISVAFAEAFCSSDLRTLKSLLAPTLRFRGPLFSFDSRSDYMRSLAAAPPEPGTCELLQVLGAEQEAAILYAYGRSETRMLIAQFARTTGEQITEIRLVFDTAELPESL